MLDNVTPSIASILIVESMAYLTPLGRLTFFIDSTSGVHRAGARDF